MVNREFQQYFLDIIKNLGIYNQQKEIDEELIYSMLIDFNIASDRGLYHQVDQIFHDLVNRYSNTQMKVKEEAYNLNLSKGQMDAKKIRLYIPLDIRHIKQGTNMIFDFISENNINHSSKIEREIRTDGIVVRVNTMEDANKIMDFVHGSPYLMEGLLPVNPFFPSNNKVGLTFDNGFSCDYILSSLISECYNELKNRNKLEYFNLQTLNSYIKYRIQNTTDQGLKDMYELLLMTTDLNFKYTDYLRYINDKKNNEKTSDIDPAQCLETAVKLTEKKYPGCAVGAIKAYLVGNANGFTREQNARGLLLNHVDSTQVISIMADKLSKSGISIPQYDEDLIISYVNLLCNKKEKETNQNYANEFEVLKQAYMNTIKKHNLHQARVALQILLNTKNCRYFTNQYKDRDKLIELIETTDFKKVILSNIDMSNLDPSDITEIINRFESVIVIGPNQNTK